MTKVCSFYCTSVLRVRKTFYVQKGMKSEFCQFSLALVRISIYPARSQVSYGKPRSHFLPDTPTVTSFVSGGGVMTSSRKQTQNDVTVFPKLQRVASLILHAEDHTKAKYTHSCICSSWQFFKQSGKNRVKMTLFLF